MSVHPLGRRRHACGRLPDPGARRPDTTRPHRRPVRMLIAVRTYRLIFQPETMGGAYQIKPVE